MKFTFYYDGKKKKKTQVVKAETKEEMMLVAKIAKCELVRNSLLKDLDFSSTSLMCDIKDKTYNMKELWNLLNKKLEITQDMKKPKKKNKSKKENKKDSNKKKKKKNKSNDKKKSSNKKEIKSTITKTSDGLIRIGRRTNY